MPARYVGPAPLETDYCLIRTTAHDRLDRIPVVLEGLDAGRVEMGAAAGDDFRIGLFNGPGRLVGTFGAESVEHIGEGDYAGLDRNVGPGQAIGIARAIPALVVTLGNEFGCADQIGRAAFQDAGANGHVT